MIGYAALLSWPVLAMAIFAKRPLAVAVAGAIVAGYLLLPTKVNIDFPLLPAIDKNSMAALAGLLAGWAVIRSRPKEAAANAHLRPMGLLPGTKLARLCLILLIVGAFMTVLTNGDALVYGYRRLPGLQPYDAFSYVLTTFVQMLPFFLARKYLADPESHRQLLVVLCIAGVIYALPALYEIRMSPRLNSKIYGFFPHNWRQHIRNDGFRPLVFLSHGLLLGLFLSTAFLAALALLREQRATQGRRHAGLIVLAAVFILGTLFLSKTLGAFLIAAVLGPAIFLVSPRGQVLLAAAVISIILAYPMLRGAGVIPVERAVSLAAKVDQDRAHSLRFRLINEDRLLAKANQKPLFGWGPRGRMRVFDEEGNDLSVTDGRWIIAIGMGGWIRYLAEFGIMSIAVLGLAWQGRKYGLTYATSGLSLMLAGNLIDLIPNDGLTPITWLMAGALMGRLELQTIPLLSGASEVSSRRRGTQGYSRPVRAPAAPEDTTPEPALSADPAQTALSQRPARQTPYARHVARARNQGKAPT